jgi:putative ATP-dependent endonuclease of OLD family
MKFHISNFRGILAGTYHFQKGLNTIIGENNAGKSTVVDALRICLSYGKQRSDAYVQLDDFYVTIDGEGKTVRKESIEFDLYFKLENENEAGIFYDILVQNADGTNELQLHFRYTVVKSGENERVRWQVWGGENEGQNVQHEVLELLNLVYLGALRDAENELRPFRTNLIGDLFVNINSDSAGNRIDSERRKTLAKKITDAVKEDTDWKSLIEYGQGKLNEHLKKTSITGNEQSVELKFLPYEFRQIVKNLQVLLPYEGATEDLYFSLSQNGLGYNNLIYISTVLGDLINKKENVEPLAYYCLLIEEPEAHLHPQLQNIFFHYLNTLNNKGIQIFITSHSPTLTAKVDLDSLLVLQKDKHNVLSLSLSESVLSSDNKKYLKKFLDVTKSQLFFSKGVILVEGISEALLFPVMSEIIGIDYMLDKAGIEVVNINGVAFSHFANLFNSNDTGKRLSIRCALVTDDDKDDDGNMSPRATIANELRGGFLKVYLASFTFEYELFKSNEILLTGIYALMHPRTTLVGESTEDRGKDLLSKLKSNKDKSELAHRIAIKLDDDAEAKSSFIVPEYISKAIKWVVAGNES